MLERTLVLQTPEGSMPTFVVHPERHGPHPVVLVMMDGLGMREALRDQARRLASAGYYVMLPDLYYRARLAEPIDRNAPDAMDRIMALVQSVTAAKAMAEAALCLDYAGQDPAARSGPAGVMGYCMGGRLAVVAAQALGIRVACAAAIHPGFANDWLQSLLASDLGQISAEVYVGAADNDPSFTADQRAKLHSALKSHAVNAEIELHKDGVHGFGVPGDRYQREHAERAWERIHALFRRRLS